uniref:Uncharacterized protein n=1 Tax=Cavia porcellus TaxID=10141 RepID=A0A286XKG8_CAVPO
IVFLFIYIFLTCGNPTPSHQGTPHALGLPRWEDAVPLALLLQAQHAPCHHPVSMTPVSRLSQSPGWGEAGALPPFLSFPFATQQLPPAMPSPSFPPSPALTYIVPYLCCKYNIKLSRE